MPGDCRVVVCDDVADFRGLLVDILSGTQGFAVVGEAENGREAVDVAGEQRPDVVLLDIAMPVMDGIEALPLIRTASPNSKVIVLTGFSSPAIRERALEGGAVGFLEKGTHPDVVVGAVREACAAT